MPAILQKLEEVIDKYFRKLFENRDLNIVLNFYKLLVQLLSALFDKHRY